MEQIYRLTCPTCGYEAAEEQLTGGCSRCGGLLEYVFDGDYLRAVEFDGPFTFWRYRPILPRVSKVVSMGEGGTPLHEAKRLGEALGLSELYLKDDTRNPTNSFRDRSASLIVSDAAGKGFDSLVCATNGNQGASLAAYSAKADITCHLIVPRLLDMGKLAQMIVHDAHVEEAAGSIEEAIARASSLAKELGWYQGTVELNSLSVEALKTISYEFTEQAPAPDWTVPDWIIVAMGSGTTIHALWKGYGELEEMGLIDEKPRLVGVQASGCAPITKAFRLGEKRPVEIEKPDTSAVAISVATPIYGQAALAALRGSSGLAVSVTDEEMLAAEREIARSEGIFAEPASAATVACIRSLIASGEIDRGDVVFSLIASSGLKTDDILQILSKRKKSTGLGSSLATKERILRIVQRRRTYGYDLWKVMGRRVTLGAIYQHLSDLEERGLITAFTEGKRRYLRISERGERAIQALDDLRGLL